MVLKVGDVREKSKGSVKKFQKGQGSPGGW